MHDDDTSSSTPSGNAGEDTGATERVLRADVVAQAIERVRARGDSTRRFAVMELPAPLFNDLCERLLSQKPVKATAEWLAGECGARDLSAPGRSSVERFSDVLFEEYQIADLKRRRTVSAGFRKAVADTSGEELGLTATRLLAEKLDDWLMRIDEIDELEVEEIEVLAKALRQVNQTLSDKRNTDARVAALEKLNAERDVAIKLKDQKLAEMKSKFEAALKAVRTGGKTKITAEDLAEVGRAVFG